MLIILSRSSSLLKANVIFPLPDASQANFTGTPKAFDR